MTYIVKENDILIIRSNGSRELVGKSALYNNVSVSQEDSIGKGVLFSTHKF